LLITIGCGGWNLTGSAADDMAGFKLNNSWFWADTAIARSIAATQKE